MDQDSTPAALAVTLAIPDEDVVVMLAAQHNPTHFAKIYEKYFQRIYAYCLRNVNNPDEAEDLASQVFVQSFRNLAHYRGGSVPAWLFRIAYGTVANHYRQSRPEVGIDDDLPEIASDTIEPLETIMITETHQKLHRLVSTLPDEDRHLLALKLDGELSSQEIGALLGKNAGAIRTQLHRIIKRIRFLYQQSEV